MATQSSDAQTYDDVPFPTQPVPPSDPARLAAVAALCGVQPQRASRARVLELGCAAGGNLVPLADRFPESTFLGIDYSPGQIATARRSAERLELSNVELRAMSIEDVDEQLGQFDYVIAHGLYSWVAPDVGKRMLALCKSLLAPHGIAYASYNTYPGWCIPMIVREVACGHTAADQPIRQRLAATRKLLRVFSDAMQGDGAPYSQLLRGEIERVLGSPDGYVAHEHLGEHNIPVYFHEFVERAAGHGLQYLGDSLLHTMFAINLGTEIEGQLRMLTSDSIATEQYIDLVSNRALRMSLLCHDDVPLGRGVGAETLQSLYFAGRFRPADPGAEGGAGGEARFVTGGGTSVSTSSAVVKAVLHELGSAWPASRSFDQLARAVSRHQEPAASEESITDALGQCLVESLVTGHVDARGEPDAFVTALGARPRASRLSRAQAQTSAWVTNRRHEAVKLDEISRNLLRSLDGQHDRAALVDQLVRAVSAGTLSILINGVPLERGDAVGEVLAQLLEQSLAAIAADALLIG